MHVSGKRIDGAGALGAAVWLGIVGSLVLLILPVFIGTLIEWRRFTNAQAGWIASADLMGFAFASIIAYRTVRRHDWRRIVLAGLCMIVVGDVSSAFLVRFEPLFAVRLLLSGVGAGLVIAVPYTLLGDSSSPERNTGIYFTFNVIAGAGALFVVPEIVAKFGAEGMFVFLALSGLVSVPVALTLLPGGMAGGEREKAVPNAAAAPSLLLILAGIAFFNFGLGGVWAFVERVGMGWGLAAESVGRILALTYLVSMLGSATAAWQADRYGYLAPYALGIVVLSMGLVVLVAGRGEAAFIMAVSALNFSWNYSLTYQFSAVYRHDRSGRMAVFIMLVQALGLMLGPGVAGTLTATAGLNAALLTGLATCLLSLGLFAVAHHVARSASTG